jgi:hypothetical protein
MGVLRQWFGPSKAEIWRQLASEIGAEFVEGKFTKSERIVAKHAKWTVTLDTFVVMAGNTAIPFTRLRAPFVNADGFRFQISRRNSLTEVGKFFGMQDIDIGIETFDHDFVIQGSDESKLRSLFLSTELRRLVDAQKDLKLSVKDDEGWFGSDFPEGVDELYFTTAGFIKEPERLKLMFELFATTLDRLCEIGSAYDNDPNVELK